MKESLMNAFFDIVKDHIGDSNSVVGAKRNDDQITKNNSNDLRNAISKSALISITHLIQKLVQSANTSENSYSINSNVDNTVSCERELDDFAVYFKSIPISWLFTSVNAHSCETNCASTCSSNQNNTLECVTMMEKIEHDLGKLSANATKVLHGEAMNAASQSLLCLYQSLQTQTQAVCLLTALWMCTKFWGYSLQRLSLNSVGFILMQTYELECTRETSTKEEIGSKTSVHMANGIGEYNQNAVEENVDYNNQETQLCDNANITVDTPVINVDNNLIINEEEITTELLLPEREDDLYIEGQMDEYSDNVIDDLVNTIENVEMALLRCNNYVIPVNQRT